MDKKCVAKACERLHINNLMMKILKSYTKGNYIRVINYHEVRDDQCDMFEKHLDFYAEHFHNCDYKEFDKYMQSGELIRKDKPGIVISFDDGFKDNYTNAARLLEKHGFTGWFMIPAGLVGQEQYMSETDLLELRNRGHIIGCHTFSHCRASSMNNEEILEKEIVYSKKLLEEMTGGEAIDIFCWAFGDAGSYTKSAYDKIVEAGYKYSFMTDSYPVLPKCEPMHIQRTNIQLYWDIDVVKFQVCGLMDLKYRRKRKEDERITS